MVMEEEEDEAGLITVSLREARKRSRGDPEDARQICYRYMLTIISILLIVFFFPVSLTICMKVVQEYERIVIFRLGRILKKPRGPGIIFIFPCMDDYNRLDLRTVLVDVMPQEVISKDGVTLRIDAYLLLRVADPLKGMCSMTTYKYVSQFRTANALRHFLGNQTLDQIITGRKPLAHALMGKMNNITNQYGVVIERIELRHVHLPASLQRIMAIEAETKRQSRAKVFAMEGDRAAAKTLKEASQILKESETALHMKQIQTLRKIAKEKNSTIVFPIPIELLPSTACTWGKDS